MDRIMTEYFDFEEDGAETMALDDFVELGHDTQVEREVNNRLLIIISSSTRTHKSTIKRRVKRKPVAPNDPRKFYQDNSVAAMLSGDLNRLRQVVEQQNTPDCIWIQRYNPKDSPNLPSTREIRGIDKIIEFTAAMQQANPDFHINISGRRLHIHEDGSGYLVSKMTYSGITIVPIAITNFLRQTRSISIQLLHYEASLVVNNHHHSNHSSNSSSSS